ncbi:MAG: hypothetical protein HY748_10075 [Elusimicrobia bacterium]|nr:hypothetical protein [Elusimicrobiota bacterium]
MEIDFAFLADCAEVNQGKMSVLGGAFDTIWVEKLPAIHPRLSFVLRLVLSPSEMGRKHSLEINIVDEDGKRIATVGGELSVGSRSPDLPAGWRQGFLSVMNFQHLTFTKFGNYCFEIVANNSSLKSVALRVAQRVPLQRAQQ